MWSINAKKDEDVHNGKFWPWRGDATVLFRKVAVVGMARSPETFRKLGMKHVF
jgi:hypothetical protein